MEPQLSLGGQFDCGTRILRVIHGRGARATVLIPVRGAIFMKLAST